MKQYGGVIVAFLVLWWFLGRKQERETIPTWGDSSNVG
jgi:hypothetical protein